MKFIFLICLVLSSSFTAAMNCDSPLKDNFKPILYSIVKDGKQSYLVGIFHQTVGKRNLPMSIQHALNEVPTFVNEVDPQDAFPKDLVVLPQNQQLSSLISPEAWALLIHKFPQTSDNLRPFIPYVRLIEGLLYSAVNMDEPDEALDHILREYASNHGLKTQFLDSSREAIGPYADGVSAELLEWSLLHMKPETVIASFLAQRDAFVKGDLKAHARLYKQLHVDMHMEQLYENLIVARNNKWIHQIDKFHEDGPIFLAVGVGHLPGLLGLLANSGFKIKRIED